MTTPLQVAVEAGARTYAIADIHGRFDLLEAALSAIKADADARPHTIVTLGDYVDRGPQIMKEGG